jgi:hypothetical protein
MRLPSRSKLKSKLLGQSDAALPEWSARWNQKFK